MDVEIITKLIFTFGVCLAFFTVAGVTSVENRKIKALLVLATAFSGAGLAVSFIALIWAQ